MEGQRVARALAQPQCSSSIRRKILRGIYIVYEILLTLQRSLHTYYVEHIVSNPKDRRAQTRSPSCTTLDYVKNNTGLFEKAVGPIRSTLDRREDGKTRFSS